MSKFAGKCTDAATLDQLAVLADVALELKQQPNYAQAFLLWLDRKLVPKVIQAALPDSAGFRRTLLKQPIPWDAYFFDEHVDGRLLYTTLQKFSKHFQDANLNYTMADDECQFANSLWHCVEEASKHVTFDTFKTEVLDLLTKLLVSQHKLARRLIATNALGAPFMKHIIRKLVQAATKLAAIVPINDSEVQICKQLIEDFMRDHNFHCEINVELHSASHLVLVVTCFRSENDIYFKDIQAELGQLLRTRYSVDKAYLHGDTSIVLYLSGSNSDDFLQQVNVLIDNIKQVFPNDYIDHELDHKFVQLIVTPAKRATICRYIQKLPGFQNCHTHPMLSNAINIDLE